MRWPELPNRISGPLGELIQSFAWQYRIYWNYHTDHDISAQFADLATSFSDELSMVRMECFWIIRAIPSQMSLIGLWSDFLGVRKSVDEFETYYCSKELDVPILLWFAQIRKLVHRPPDDRKNSPWSWWLCQNLACSRQCDYSRFSARFWVKHHRSTRSRFFDHEAVRG